MILHQLVPCYLRSQLRHLRDNPRKAPPDQLSKRLCFSESSLSFCGNFQLVAVWFIFLFLVHFRLGRLALTVRSRACSLPCPLLCSELSWCLPNQWAQACRHAEVKSDSLPWEGGFVRTAVTEAGVQSHLQSSLSAVGINPIPLW